MHDSAGFSVRIVQYRSFRRRTHVLEIDVEQLEASPVTDAVAHFAVQYVEDSSDYFFFRTYSVETHREYDIQIGKPRKYAHGQTTIRKNPSDGTAGLQLANWVLFESVKSVRTFEGFVLPWVSEEFLKKRKVRFIHPLELLWSASVLRGW